MIEEIREYLLLGLALIPTKREDKRPCTSWDNWAANKPTGKQWNSWWKAYPGCNVSVIYSSTVTPEGKQLVCVDTDSEAAEAWVSSQPDLPPTPTVQTCDGFHRYYLAPVGLKHFSGTTDRPEVRCGRHYSQLPPSVHPTGVVYQWLAGLSLSDVPFADLPQWGLDIMAQGEDEPEPAAPRPSRADDDSRDRRYGLSALERQSDALASTPQGGRNTALNNAALGLGSLVAGGCLEEHEVRQALLAACQQNGLLKDDGTSACEKTLASGFNKGKQTPRSAPAQETRQRPASRNVGIADEDDPRPSDEDLADLMEQAEANVNECGHAIPAAGNRKRKSVAPAELSEIAGDMMEAFEEERRRDRVIRGLRTGFPTLDNHFCGFYRQQLVVVHGLSGYGKSHFANHCVFATALAEYAKGDDAALTIVFMCEGLKQNLFSAYLGYRWGVPARCREAGSEEHMTPAIEDAIMNGMNEFPLLPIAVTDDITELVDIEEDIRATVASRRVSGVVIDQLQRVKAPGVQNPSHQGVNMIVERLDNLSKLEVHVPILGLSQTTSDQKGNFNPKYGTTIREASSACIQIDRGVAGCKREDAVQSNVMRAINDKHRHGKVAPVLTLMGDYETGRMWEEDDFRRVELARGYASGDYQG